MACQIETPIEVSQTRPLYDAPQKSLLVPVLGAIVLVNDVSGALRSVHRTDASGKTAVSLRDASTLSIVTISYTERNGAVKILPEMRTFQQIDGAQFVHVVKGAEPPSRRLPVPMTVTVKGILHPEDEGKRVWVYFACGENSPLVLTSDTDYSGTVDVIPCGDDDTIDVYAHVTDDDYLPTRYGWAWDVPFEQGGIGETTISVTNEVMMETRLSVTGVPPEAERLHLLQRVFGDSWTNVVDFSSDVDGPGSSEMLNIPVPIQPFRHVNFRSEAILQLDSDGRFLEARLVHHGAAPPSELTWNVSADLALPTELVRELDFSDSKHPRVSWSLSDEGKLGDYVEATALMVVEDPDVNLYWSVYGEPQRHGQAVFPELPDELKFLRPVASNEARARFLGHYDDGLGGYSRFLENDEGGSLRKSTSFQY